MSSTSSAASDAGHRSRRGRHRLHRTRVAEPRHQADGGGRLAVSGLSDVHGTRAPRVPAAPRPSMRIFKRVSLRKSDRAHRNQYRRRFVAILKDVRAKKGYAAIQDELDLWDRVCRAFRSLEPHGRIVAAANCSDVTNRLDRDTMIKKRLPVLQRQSDASRACSRNIPELTQLRGVRGFRLCPQQWAGAGWTANSTQGRAPGGASRGGR